MAEITIRIPDDFMELVAGAGESIYVEAIKVVARRRIGTARRRLKEMSKKVLAYETKYGKSYNEFSETVSDTLKGHNDWIDWTYLVHSSRDLERKIEKVQLLVGK